MKLLFISSCWWLTIDSVSDEWWFTAASTSSIYPTALLLYPFALFIVNLARWEILWFNILCFFKYACGFFIPTCCTYYCYHDYYYHDYYYYCRCWNMHWIMGMLFLNWNWSSPPTVLWLVADLLLYRDWLQTSYCIVIGCRPPTVSWLAADLCYQTRECSATILYNIVWALRQYWECPFALFYLSAHL